MWYFWKKYRLGHRKTHNTVDRLRPVWLHVVKARLMVVGGALPPDGLFKVNTRTNKPTRIP